MLQPQIASPAPTIKLLLIGINNCRTSSANCCNFCNAFIFSGSLNLTLKNSEQNVVFYNRFSPCVKYLQFDGSMIMKNNISDKLYQPKLFHPLETRICDFIYQFYMMYYTLFVHTPNIFA